MDETLMPAKRSDPPLDRVIADAFFPSSPAATTREAIFSDFLAEILGARPRGKDISQLKDAFMSLSYMTDSPEAAELLWAAFVASYTITGERGARGKDPKRYVVPFHPEIAKAMKPKESRPFGKWYIMLMSSGDPPTFNGHLHDKFVARLRDLAPSNLLEKIAVEAAGVVGYEKVASIDTTPIRPYVEQLSLCFQEDLECWINYNIESSSRWLQGVSDLLSYYMMMSIVQFSRNVHQEFEAVRNGKKYRAELIPMHFGEWDEAASQNREFARSWEGRNGLERELFDSWGRLVALRVVSDSARSARWAKYSNTLSEATDLPDVTIHTAVKNGLIDALNRFDVRSSSEDIGELSWQLATEVTKHYESKQPSLQSPATMGINVVFQLGNGSSKQFIRRQNKVGVTLRLDTPAIIFFAKIFNMHKGLSGSYAEFVQFLQYRGMKLDEESQSVVLSKLEALGMIEKQSDSGESIYVRALQ
ncbi:DNA phosphorothioation-dependent restriction protein DptG [Methanomassiliicoccus luminyensis]|uniref:DNA phosphorothioation-dependent restriction protein DptG n=1 Tax=Methanomassiliicoccus luminyensis TaxID=1080712 RepID=UPI000360A26E|nr:DNA phosphorothioation-dependent restriction protein DptG [Methanomassiliicoccus luminyensis]